MLTQRKIKAFVVAFVLLFILYYFGTLATLFQEKFDGNFHYPYDGDVKELVQQLRAKITPTIPPINSYNFNFTKPCNDKCRNVNPLSLVFVVKSAPENWHRRMAIRASWGLEDRFSDVKIRTVFLLGERKGEELQKQLDEESAEFQDLVQANFTDSYFNNTFKTVMGLTWVVRYCPTAPFYMFADDDYYVSTKNLLDFVANPTGYQNYYKKETTPSNISFEEDVILYAGHVAITFPIRDQINKYYVPLDEYRYDMWPPFINAGAYVLSREALLNMYYATFYTKHFRFDDIYLAIVAFKCKIEPYHCDYFYNKDLAYTFEGYQYVVASHGYGNPGELMDVWTQQRAKNNA